jgi:predicted XRE-type DNA-binding protein
MNVTWKPVVGYDGTHEVSSNGLVRGISSRWGKKENPRNLCIRHNRYGYPEVRLTVNNKTKRFNVHRLVAEAFIPNPENKPIVNHKDGFKKNNCVGNLEWVTAKENTQHAINMRLMGSVGESNHNSKFKRKDIIKIRKMYATGKFKQVELADIFNTNQPHISAIVRGERWSHLD